MKTYKMEELGTLRELVAETQGVDDPVIVFDGDDECLVAMRPSVFERILVDTDRIAYESRRSLRL